MIKIITGNINSGKTTKMQSMYKLDNKGDGFICKKKIDHNKFYGYDLFRLSTMASIPFIRLIGNTDEDWDEHYQFSKYSFSIKGFLFAEEIINDIIMRNISPVLIDEIGPLELQKKGFFKIFSKLLSLEKEIIFSVRKSCLADILNDFCINEHELIHV